METAILVKSVIAGAAIAILIGSTSMLSLQSPYKNVIKGPMPQPVGTTYLQGQVLGANYLNQ